MFSCAMCGKDAGSKKWHFRWYQADNGERSRELVCAKCADLHLQLTEGK